VKQGLLWWLRNGLDEQDLAKAVARARVRLGRAPDEGRVSVALLPKQAGEMELAGVRLIGDDTVAEGYVWLCAADDHSRPQGDGVEVEQLGLF
jgi:hypothetical protein